MFVFRGNDNRIDASGAVIEIDTSLYKKLPGGYRRSLIVRGSGNILRGLSIRNTGPNQGSGGNTLFAGDLAAVLLASDVAFGSEAVQFFHKLLERVRDQLRSDAETLVDKALAESEDAAAEARYEAQQADREQGWY